MNRHACLSWRWYVSLVLFLFAVNCIIPPASAHTNISWTGLISDDWNNSTNWTPQQIPTASDTVIISSGDVTIPADGVFAVMDWNGGVISGVLTVASNAVLNIDATDGNYAESLGVVTNYGTIDWSNGVWYLINNSQNYFGSLYNEQGGQVVVQGGLTMSSDNYPDGFLVNAGTLTVRAGSDVAELGVLVTNLGAVEVQSGTLSLGNGGSLDGQFNTTSGAAINLEGGTFAQAGSPVFSGNGQSQFTGNTLTLGSNIIPGLALNGGTIFLGPAFQGGTITNLTISDSTLSGSNCTVSGTLNWSGGVIGGNFTSLTLTIETNGVLNIDATNGNVVDLEAPLTNYGTINWSAGDWYVVNITNESEVFPGAVYNEPGGLLNVQGDLNMPSDQYAPYGFVYNAGTFRKSGGGGLAQIPIAFTNSGVVEADEGTISFQGVYSDSSEAKLVVSLGGATPGVGYGLINFNTPVSFDGTLTTIDTNGFQPTSGESFDVLSFPSSTGTFSCMSLDLGGGFLLQPQFTGTDLILTTTTYVTNGIIPQLFVNPSLAGVAITWPEGFPGWTLESATNLSSPAWRAVPGVCGNQAIVPAALPQQFFRLWNGN